MVLHKPSENNVSMAIQLIPAKKYVSDSDQLAEDALKL